MPSRLLKACLFALCALLLAACRPPAPADDAGTLEAEAIESPAESGAVSMAPVEPVPEQAPEADLPEPALADDVLDWTPMELADGILSISCELDYGAEGDGTPVGALDRETLEQAMTPCSERGVMRLRYEGRLTGEFTALIERVIALADELEIDKRVLDLDSAGGQVEDSMEAGDLIAESGWTVWVREGSNCHSSCVFILSAGDSRLITGRVGIHRIIRMSSTATTRRELNAELRAVHDRVRGYLERNGAAVAVADMMMVVPNRSLRLLSTEELQLYGLDGVNPAQDDLDRLRLMRKCGDDFVRRRDSFVRAFDARCKAPDTGLEALNACGLELRENYGFPDETCPAESPLSEFDLAADYVFAPGPDTASEETGEADEADATSGDASSQSMNPPD
ncbi:hypothetical protein ACOPJQ_13900 [Luteimonas dalianensis]|uniref:COG3904 family protein n=1 Tax=Luteimonas dalianensis TaxID=1148196 RepID=UPI003BEFF30E